MSDSSKKVGQFALETDGDPRDAASSCFTAGLSLLAMLQVMNPEVDGMKALTTTFDVMRDSFPGLVEAIKKPMENPGE